MDETSYRNSLNFKVVYRVSEIVTGVGEFSARLKKRDFVSELSTAINFYRFCFLFEAVDKNTLLGNIYIKCLRKSNLQAVSFPNNKRQKKSFVDIFL